MLITAVDKLKAWRFNKELNLVVLIQLVLLVSLIVSSWFNLQHQLDILQYDVNRLLKSQEDFGTKLEYLSAMSLSHEYRLQLAEESVSRRSER